MILAQVRLVTNVRLDKTPTAHHTISYTQHHR